MEAVAREVALAESRAASAAGPAVVHGQPKVALAGVRRTQTPTSVNVPLDPLPQELAGGRGGAAKAAKMSAGGSGGAARAPQTPRAQWLTLVGQVLQVSCELPRVCRRSDGARWGAVAAAALPSACAALWLRAPQAPAHDRAFRPVVLQREPSTRRRVAAAWRALTRKRARGLGGMGEHGQAPCGRTAGLADLASTLAPSSPT